VSMDAWPATPKIRSTLGLERRLMAQIRPQALHGKPNNIDLL
jgi:hypothetical protein